MLSRIYSIIFLLAIVGGLIFQRQYMKDSAAQIKLLEARMQTDTLLIGVKNVSVNRYVRGRRSDKIAAQKGEILTDGLVRLENDIWFTRYRDAEGKVSSRLHSESVFGRINMDPAGRQARNPPLIGQSDEVKIKAEDLLPQLNNTAPLADNVAVAPPASPTQSQTTQKKEPMSPSQAFIESQATLESFHFPKEVSIFLEDGIVRTNNVFFNFSEQLVFTEAAVTYGGKGKELRGVGMSYNLSTGEFEMGGPVVGRFEPQSLAELRAQSTEQTKKAK